jgi:pimeloyl-ACP methyl ester carboxylesterase
MAQLAHSRWGSGEPLVLLHALGLSRKSWAPVIPALAERFDVVAVDLPGFGESEPLPPDVEPTPVALARCVAELIDQLGLGGPHVAGNSLGGWVALELAHLRPLASLALVSPAGLWRGRTPLYCRVSLRATRWLALRAPAVLMPMMGSPAGRTVVLAQSHGRPWAMTPEQARTLLRDMGTSPGFDAVLWATFPRRYVASQPLGMPVSIAFGSRDRVLLRRQSRHLDELPPGTRPQTIPGGGHVPFADNPEAVAAFVTAAAAAPG